jgi:hypothetical protein
MGFASAEDLPVVLIGDVDRGGVIASLVGTVAVLEPRERARLRGFVVNKFRGDPALFAGARTESSRAPGSPISGWCRGSRRPRGCRPRTPPARQPALGGGRTRARSRSRCRAAADRQLRRSRPAARRARRHRRLVPPGHALPGDADAVILAGSKATIADLAALRAAGWDVDLAAHVRRGGRVLGLCGGYQMLGTAIADPDGIEGRRRASPVSACSTSRRRSGPPRSCARRGAARATACASPATRCTWVAPTAPTPRGRCWRWIPAPTARSAPTAGSPAAICTACSPRPRSAPPGSVRCAPPAGSRRWRRASTG